MYIVIISLIVLASLLLTLLVLVQDSKGGGLSAGFSSANQIVGVRKTTDVVEKGTWVLVTIVILLSISSVAFRPKAHTNLNESEISKEVQGQLPAQPGFGETTQPTPAPAQ